MNSQFQWRLVAIVVAVATCMNGESVAQQTGTKKSVNEKSTSLVRAKRIMKTIDKDKNGTFEKSEDAGAWKRYQTLDSNKDGVLSLAELRRQRPDYLETGGKRSLDVVYKTIGKRELLLDIYYPTDSTQESDSPAPVVIYTHGGGWAAGSKSGVAKGSFKDVFRSLLSKGFAVASVGYRLARKDSGVLMRDCVIDSKDAMRYLAANSETLKLDSTRFFLMGDSAGGQIAQMLLLSSPESLPGDKELASAAYKVVAGVSWYGPCDFEKAELFNHDDRTNFNDRFGPRILGADFDPNDKLKLYREMSPVNYLTADSPPLLMIQGDKDTTIPVKHAHYMKQKADALKAPVEVLIVKNAGHNWRKVDADIQPTREEIVQRTVQFFVDQLNSNSK